MPRGGPPLQLGELLSFEIELNPEGKKRASAVMRQQALPRPAPGAATAVPASRPRHAADASLSGRSDRQGRSLFSRLIAVLLVTGLAWTAYGKYQQFSLPAAAQPVAEITAPALPAAMPSFRCDGRQHCSQMSSCEEAKFFLAQCPGVKMDGDGDGLPCEEQHCR